MSVVPIKHGCVHFERLKDFTTPAIFLKIWIKIQYISQIEVVISFIDFDWDC